MRVSRSSQTLFVTLLLAAAGPLHAQFSSIGCPDGAAQVSPSPNGFTAGATPPNSQVCLLGTFQISASYDVTLTRTDTNATLTVPALSAQNSDTDIVVPVPPAFYSAIGGTTPVTINISINSSFPNTAQTGTFQINPPLATGGPVFINQVNTPVTWTLFTGGSTPYTKVYGNGTLPNGFPNFPSDGNTLSGTPSELGEFDFTATGTDGWGTNIPLSLSAYIVPIPSQNAPTPPSIPVGSGATQVTITGTGILSPITIRGVPYPGTTVQASFGSNAQVLTPSNYGANQLTVTVPANMLTQEGYLQLILSNLSVTNSNQETVFVDPVITSLSSYTHTVNTPPFTLTISGAGFANGASVFLGTTLLTSHVVNSGVITATVPTVALAGSQPIFVANPDSTESAPVTFTFQAAPTITTLTPSSVNAGSPAFTLLVNGGQLLSGMTIYFGTTPLVTAFVNNQRLSAIVPAGLVANQGTVPVTVVTADSYYSNILPFTINPSGPPPLQLLTFSPLTPGVVNTPYTFTFSASAGAGGYSYAVTSGAPPAGLQLSSAGVLSGTPTAIGTSQFTVQVSDSASATVARQFSLTIAPQPLSLTTGALANTTVNTPISVQFAGTGGVTPYTFVEFGALPPGVQFSSAGLLSGTPTKSGSYPILVFINDSAYASASKSYTLNVAQPGILITPSSPLPPGQLYTNYSTMLTATGGVGAPYAWSATGLPPGLNIANNSGLIDGLPTATGTFTLVVTAKDYTGASATQTYTLVIASPVLTITTATLPNSAVGSPYSAVLSASGGSGTYTYTATGMPAGITLSSTGVFSGTPTTAGPSTIVVTVTDAAGATATANFRTTTLAKLVVTPVTIPIATLGVAIAPVTLTATGGASPYQWQSGSLPPGLSLASNGTLSGTPTAAGNYSFPVSVVDNNGSLSNGTEQLTVALPTQPTATITGLPASTAPAQQQSLQVLLSGAYPVPITATLTMTFKPTSGADDPAIQFSTGGRAATVVVPAGSTLGASGVGVQTGTVAGVITITSQLSSGPGSTSTGPTQTITVQPSAPVITKVTATRTSTGFTVTITGYASNRDVETAAYQFSASEGANLQTTQLNTTITPLFTTWYGGTTSAPFGSQFTLSQPFNVSGTNSSILSVTVMLTNALGTSGSATAILQ